MASLLKCVSILMMLTAISVSAQWDASNPRNLTVGVLDNSLNYTKTWLQWVPTFQDYFNTYAAKLNATFRIQMEVYSFDNLTAAAASGRLDMTFTNTGHSATLGVLYGFKPVVSLENMRLGYPQTLFGGVVVTRNDSGVRMLADCFENGQIAAVSKDGFGGYIMQKREALRQGIEVDDDKIFFANSNQPVLSLTNNGSYICGFARTDTLEDMTKKTPQLTNYLKVVNRKKGAQYAFFPFACSTELYPEWMVMVRSDPNRVSPTETELIRGILMAIRTSDPAAIIGQYSRWFPPLSTDSILEALYDTGRLQRTVPPPYKPLWEIIIPVTVVGIILILVIFRTVSRWSQVRFAPKDSDECHLALVTVKNLPALWEAYPSSLPAVLATQESMVKRLTRQHGCYFVRKIGDCYLIAARDPTALASLSANLHSQIHSMNLLGSLKPEKTMKKYLRRGESEVRSSLSDGQKPGTPSKITSHAESNSQSSDRQPHVQRELALVIGLHKGPVFIDYNAEQHVYDYSGPGVDGTAVAVDAARGHYTLATAEFTAAFRGATHDSFTVAPKPGSTLSFILSTALPQYSVEAFVEKKDEEEQESAAAALDAAKHGLSNRRVTILALRLRFPSSSVVDASISAFNKVDSILQVALAESKGTVIAEADGLYVIAFNALAPVAGQMKRALSCVLEIANGVAEFGPEYRMSAGVASGACLCGTVASGNKMGTRPLVFGSAVQRAMALECLCCGFPDVPLLVGGELREEINALALFQIVTLVAGPNGRVPILAPMSMREGDDGEWMYVLEDGDRANPFREINEAFDSLLQDGSCEKLQTLVSRELSSSTVPQGKEKLQAAYDRLSRLLPLIVNEPSLFTQPWTLAANSERRLWLR